MRSVLPLSVNGAWMAIDAALVVEILGARPRAPLPDAPPLAPAAVAFRGRAVAALDLGLLAGGAPALAGGEVRARTVIARAGASTVALPVDAAREVQEIDGDGSMPILDIERAVRALVEDGR